MRRLPVRLAAALSTTALVSTLAVATTAPAQAAPPVVVDDEMTIYANTAHFPDLLANDSDPDDDDVLKICRLREVLEPPVLFMDFLGTPILFAEPGTSGVFEFTYYACDYEALVPGTLTVTVKPSPKATVALKKLPKRPGKIRVTNKSGFPLSFAWGHARAEDSDGQVRVAKKSSKIVTVRRTAITWQVYNGTNGAEKVGYLRGITLPKKGKQLPPSPRPVGSPSIADLLTDQAPASAPWLSPLRTLTRR